MLKSDKELEEMEKGRDICQEVLDGVREIQSGKGKKVSVVLPPAAPSRSHFSIKRTLKDGFSEFFTSSS